MVLDSSLYDLSYHSYVCQSTANIVKISPKLRFLDDHNSKNTRLMWLKFGVAKLLYICIDLTKFKENPGGLSFFCVDLTWNDPAIRVPGHIAVCGSQEISWSVTCVCLLGIAHRMQESYPPPPPPPKPSKARVAIINFCYFG